MPLDTIHLLKHPCRPVVLPHTSDIGPAATPQMLLKNCQRNMTKKLSDLNLIKQPSAMPENLWSMKAPLWSHFVLTCGNLYGLDLFNFIKIWVILEFGDLVNPLWALHHCSREVFVVRQHICQLENSIIGRGRLVVLKGIFSLVMSTANWGRETTESCLPLASRPTMLCCPWCPVIAFLVFLDGD